MVVKNICAITLRVELHYVVILVTDFLITYFPPSSSSGNSQNLSLSLVDRPLPPSGYMMVPCGFEFPAAAEYRPDDVTLTGAGFHSCLLAAFPPIISCLTPFPPSMVST